MRLTVLGERCVEEFRLASGTTNETVQKTITDLKRLCMIINSRGASGFGDGSRVR